MSVHIKTHQLILFALPALVSAAMHNPVVAGIIPSLYATEFGLDLAVIGSVMLAARIFDAVTDPVIGLLSDKTESRFGRRKPWVAAGAVLTVITIWFLFRPGETVTISYYLTLSILLYLAWTIMEIPYVAWMLEMSRDTKERTRINAFRSGALLVGGILFYLFPKLVPGSDGSMNFQVLGVLAIFIAISVPLFTVLAVKYVPEGEVFEGEAAPKITELWQSIKSNRPFLAFLAMYAFIGLASGVGNVVAFMYIDTYLDIGTRFTELFLPAVILGPLTLPLWTWVLNRYGKYRVSALAFTIYMLLMPMPWFVSPGESAFLPMLLLYAASSLFMPLLMVSMPAILGDIIDYDELQTGKNRAGQYSAFLTLIAKATTAIGGPLALIAIGVFGYQPGAVENTETAIFGLRVVYNLVPPLLVLPGILLLWYFPINDKSQVEIKNQLEARAAVVTPA
ncbi:MAG: MFS transporter [Xanthomonadales bacterium]|nr:MFS transporter [Xanthomonadales bacterium]